MFFYVHPKPWGNDPNLTSIFFQMGWFNHQIGVLKKAISYEPMQVCQADHNIVYTALGEEEIDFGPRDSEANIFLMFWLGKLRVS